MSILSEKINTAITNKKSIWLNEDDGSSHHLTAAGNIISIIDGKGCEYIEVTRSASTMLYNLNKVKSIKID